MASSLAAGSLVPGSKPVWHTGELLDGHLHLQLAGALVVVGLDAADEVRLRLLDRLHQLDELAAELLTHRAHLARGALVLGGEDVWL